MNLIVHLFLIVPLIHTMAHAAQQSPTNPDNDRAAFSGGPSSPTMTLLDQLKWHQSRQQNTKPKLAIITQQNPSIVEVTNAQSNEVQATEQPGLPPMIRSSPAAHAQFEQEKQSQEAHDITLFHELENTSKLIETLAQRQTETNRLLLQLSKQFQRVLVLHKKE